MVGKVFLKVLLGNLRDKMLKFVKAFVLEL